MLLEIVAGTVMTGKAVPVVGVGSGGISQVGVAKAVGKLVAVGEGVWVSGKRRRL